MRDSRDFLAKTPWAKARHEHLAGDASARQYERLYLGQQSAVLMDAPKGCGDDIGDFLRIGAHLSALGLSAPQTYEADQEAGFALIEDLGDEVFSKVVADNRAQELPLYHLAAEVLAHLQSAPAPENLPNLTAQQWAQSTDFALDFYAFAITGKRTDDHLIAALEAALSAHADGPRVLLLRDFHAGNLLYLPQREGLAQVGLLDYQLAQLGQPEYDLVSLLQDARRDVPAEVEAAVLQAFAAKIGKPLAQAQAAYAVLGALRALRILGIFARLCVISGKDQYLIHLPRVWGQLQQNLAHPALSELRRACSVLPEPTEEAIEEIRKKCLSPAFL